MAIDWTFGFLLDPVLTPLMNLPSPWNLLLLSFIITSATTLVYKFATDQKLMKEIKEEMKSLNKQIKENKHDSAKVMELNKKVWELMPKQMMQQFKPMLITFIPVILIFGWLRGYYTDLGNPAILFGLGWIWIYLIFSILFTIALRKLLNVH